MYCAKCKLTLEYLFWLAAWEELAGAAVHPGALYCAGGGEHELVSRAAPPTPAAPKEGE